MFIIEIAMRYIKENIIQILAMIASLCMLIYGCHNDNSLVMVVSTVLPIVVWFIDKYFSIKKEKAMTSKLFNTNKRLEELEKQSSWQ